MRIASLNIHAGRCGTGRKRPSLGAIVELLRDARPDVCLLQEVDRRMPRSGFADQAARLARAMRRGGETEWHFAFHACLGFGPLGQYGNAILSREPLARVRRLPLSATSGEARGAVGVLISGESASGRTPYALWTAHLGLREEWRETQLATLAGAVNADRDAGLAAVVGGDFNAEGDSPEVSRFLERTGLRVVSPDVPTFPASAPAHRIDFLFAAPGLQVADAGVVANTGATDHCLLWVDLV